jgi:hypothetical protein
MTECSANEIEGLAARAARGAGAGVAQAAHFGRAAAMHLARGGAGADLLSALDALPGGPVNAVPLALLAAGGEVRIDTGGQEALAESYLAALPFAARVIGRGAGWLDAHLSRGDRRAVSLPARIALDADTQGALAAFAARTYVPQSESSRLSGAGAGLTDND